MIFLRCSPFRLLHDLKKQGIAIVLACHEQYLVEGMADKVIVLENKNITLNSNTSLSLHKDDYMVISFTLNDKNAVQRLASIKGVIEILHKDEMTILYVTFECSDDILTKILHVGGSICSVNRSIGRVNI